MIRDSFSGCHPAVLFGYFAVAIVLCVIFLHPAFVLVSLMGAALYLICLKRRKAIKILIGMIPVFLFCSVVNPLFNTLGEHVLFTIAGRPYTWEALCYGMAISGMFIGVILWFFCYSEVMTSDKFTSLFAPLMPALSLLLVMVLRLVPSYVRKAQQIHGVRQSIGKAGAGSRHEKLEGGITVLSSLTSWALEGSVITADSMRARGYGTARRTSFQLYRFEKRDLIFSILFALALVLTIVSAVQGCAKAAFTPVMEISPLRGASFWLGLSGYTVFLLLPVIYHLWEELSWHKSLANI